MAWSTHKEKGSVLVLTVLISLLLMGIGLTATWLSSQQSQVNATMNRRAEAYRAAMAGLQRAGSILGGESNWDAVLDGCSTMTTDTEKGIVLCAGNAELKDERVLPDGTVSADETYISDYISYTVWVRNDDDEVAGGYGGVLTADTDSRLIVRSEGKGRDGLSFVALETVFARSASGGVQESNYSQARMQGAGGNAARAAIE